MLLDFRKPHVYILEWCISFSGKYYAFYGSHYHAGKSCWVVGSSNKESGEILMKHFNQQGEPLMDEEAIRLLSVKEWEKFKEGMLRKPDSEEQDDRHIPRPWEREAPKKIQWKN